MKGISVSSFHHFYEKQVGVSIGIINIAEELTGLQIGLLNIAKNNPPLFRVLPILNFHAGE
jgi:hypothetical protein